jgi:hypothetical protein
MQLGTCKRVFCSHIRTAADFSGAANVSVKLFQIQVALKKPVRMAGGSFRKAGSSCHAALESPIAASSRFGKPAKTLQTSCDTWTKHRYQDKTYWIKYIGYNSYRDKRYRPKTYRRQILSVITHTGDKLHQKKKLNS